MTFKFIENWSNYLYQIEKLLMESTIIIVREETVAHVFVRSQKCSPSTTSLTKRCFLLGSLQSKNMFLSYHGITSRLEKFYIPFTKYSCAWMKQNIIFNLFWLFALFSEFTSVLFLYWSIIIIPSCVIVQCSHTFIKQLIVYITLFFFSKSGRMAPQYALTLIFESCKYATLHGNRIFVGVKL